MKRRSLFSMLAAATLLLGFGATGANAGSTVVSEYGGAFNWSLASTGGSTPTVTITFSSVLLTSVNNTDITSVDGSMKTLVLSLTQVTGNPNWSWTGTSGAESQTFGSGASSATLGYAVSPPGPNVFAGDGVLFTPPPITGLTSNSLPGYDFSPFAGGGSLLLTFGKTGVNLGQDIDNGTSVSGTGSFTAVANVVPEPASLALLGIGMTGFLAFRRFFKKTSVA